MPYNGTGTYTAPPLPGSFNPATNGQPATPADWNTLLTDLSTALSTAWCTDGQSTVSADIPMASHKFTGLAVGVNAADSVRFDQVLPPAGASVATLLRSYLAGLKTSNNVGSPNTVVDVAAGVGMDSTNVQMLVATAGSINCATTGANGLDGGALANTTWYASYVIGKTDGTTAFIASTNATTPSPMPSGYTLLRRIGFFKTDASAHIRAFLQTGDLFQWVIPANDYTLFAVTATQTLTLLNVPTGVAVEALLHGIIYQDTGAAVPWVADMVTPGITVPASGAMWANFGAEAATLARVLTNTSAQVKLEIQAASGTFVLTASAEGWVDRRGRDA